MLLSWKLNWQTHIMKYNKYLGGNVEHPLNIQKSQPYIFESQTSNDLSSIWGEANIIFCIYTFNF